MPVCVEAASPAAVLLGRRAVIARAVGQKRFHRVAAAGGVAGKFFGAGRNRFAQSVAVHLIIVASTRRRLRLRFRRDSLSVAAPARPRRAQVFSMPVQGFRSWPIA